MLKRHLTQLIKSSLEDFPAVLIIGARQVGKSTLAQQLVSEGILEEYKTLDDLTLLTAANTDPDDFIDGLSNKVALDEIQRVPDLLRALKKSIDKDRSAGRFLLTGSANILSYPQVSESLAGRLDVIHLEGLSLAELFKLEQPSGFLKALFACENQHDFMQFSRKRIKEIPLINKQLLLEKIFFGGFPEIALKQKSSFNQRWFSSYQSAYIERDVRDINKQIDIIPFGKLITLLSLQTANLVAVSNLAKEIGLDQRTIQRYMRILKLTFQIYELNPWFTNTRKRLTKMPKYYINDSGLACYLLGIDSVEALSNSLMLGALLETWVLAELRKNLPYHQLIQLSFYRTHQGKEVDFVLERGDKLCGLEVKLSSSLSRKDFAGLIDLQQATNQFHLGCVLYLGNEIVSFGENLLALPMSLLM